MLAYQTYDLSTVFLLLVLLVATITDFRRHRIPNWLTFGSLICGLTLQTVFLGGDGLLSGMAGAGVGLAVLLPFFLLGGMGAGDVKLMAAVGSIIGFKTVVLAAAVAVCFAGLYAITLIVVKGEWSSFLQRYVVSLQTRHYVAPGSGSVAQTRFPFALAIAGGTLTALAMMSQLDFYNLSSELSYQWQLWGVK